MKKLLISVLILIIASLFSFGEVTFSELNVTPDDNLIFKATVDLPEWDNYDTLFVSTLQDGNIKQLTFFPEKIALLDNQKVLQIQNRFGVFRSDSELKNVRSIDLFPAFVNGSEIATGKINPIQASPDGKFLIYSRPTSTAYGELCLYDLAQSLEIIISNDFDLTLRNNIALWAPNSKYFVYSTKGHIYYFSIPQYLENRIIAENLREVCEGTLSAASWDNTNHLYYITGSLVYKIASTEFFTQSLYTRVLRMGNIAGKIPFGFDPNFDQFWISPDGEKILLNKGGGNIILYFLNIEDYVSTGATKSLPYLYLPRNTLVTKVLWSKGDVITLLAKSLENGVVNSSLFRLDIPTEGDISSFTQTLNEGVRDIILSPEETQIALVTDNNILIYYYSTFYKKNEIEFDMPISALWRSETELIIAGIYTCNYFNLSTNTNNLISLSQPGEFGFSSDNSYIKTRVNDVTYKRSFLDTEWSTTSNFNIRENEVASTNFRVYLEVTTRGSYNNIVMIRNIKQYGTEPLFPPEKFEYEAFPLQDELISFENFTNGSRIRGRNIALVFNAIDSIEGLTTILNVLAQYRLRCTFFINGEAIRRYPAAIREIAESGHEVGSLFYIPFNMTDSRFSIDKEFIMNGLARTEDEYFNATGKEVSLLWHAPFYFINTEMIEASQEMNYIYIGRDIDSLDWVTHDDLLMASGIYLPSSELVERIIEKKQPGSIVSIQVGIPEERRDDYLFQKLDLLINGLIQRGYSIVPVSNLIENSK